MKYFAQGLIIVAILISALLIHPPVTAQSPCTLAPQFYYLGEASERTKNVQAALDYIASTRLDPNDPQYFVNRATLLFNAAEFDKLALADYNTALKLDPQNPTIYLLKANVFFFAARYEEAIRTYRTAIEIYSTTADPTADLAKIMLAQAYIADQRYDDASNILIQLFNTGRQPALTKAIMGLLSANLGNPEVAEAYWSLVEDLDPSIASFFIDQAFNFYNRKGYAAAIANATLALRFSNRNPNAQLTAYYLRAASQYSPHSFSAPLDNREIEQVIADTTQAIAIDGSCAPFYSLRGSIYYYPLKISDLAIADLNTAIALDPNYFPPYRVRRDIYYELGENVSTDNDPDIVGDYWDWGPDAMLSGNLSFELGDYEMAAVSYYAASLFQSDPLDAVLGLGNVYHTLGGIVQEYLLYTRYIERINPPADSPVRQRLAELEQFRDSNPQP